MGSIWVVIVSFLGFILAYNTYGRFLSRRIFSLAKDAVVPSVELRDDIDYVPTKKEVLFGHHYTSIAGLGPILGPAIGIIWGWVPALLWVFFGSIVMGAVHDLGALVVSVRKKGKSIGDIAREIINPRVRILFLLIIFFTLWIVIAIFAMIIAILFDMYPQAVFPVWMEIPIAIWMGYMIYRRRKHSVPLAIIAVIFMYITVVIGAYFPFKMPSLGGLSPLIVWMLILFIYSYFASILPVWKLLQPRDYINAHELIIVLVLLFMGSLIAHPPIVAPPVRLSPPGAPPIWPMLFVVIACGAISGFHSLVSSGTSSKQLAREEDAQFVGYGSMLAEGILAVLVIVAVAAGLGIKMKLTTGEILTGSAAWSQHYSSWAAAKGMGSKISAFITGSGNLLGSMKIPYEIAITIMGVFLVSFASTTLDTATRIQRYVITELATTSRVKAFRGRYSATFFAVATAMILAFYGEGGKGALILWPLFGTLNQLLAGLALLVVTVYLYRLRKPVVYTFLPMFFMITMTGWAMVINMFNFFQGKRLLFGIGACVFLLELWMIGESILALREIGKGLSGKADQ